MVTTLEKLKDGSMAVIVEIQGGRGVRQRLGNLGVHPGEQIRILRGGFFGGPALIEVHGIEVGVGRRMAQKIVVETQDKK